MPVDKKIKISVEDKQLKDLNVVTRRLADDMIRSSRKYSTSAKEVVKDIENQIKLLEKRNSLDKQMRVSNIQYQPGTAAYKSELTKIRREDTEAKLQTRLLREMIDTIKLTAKEEIREDRKNVEQQIKSDKSLNQLGISGKGRFAARDALKRTIQKDILGELGEEESIQNQRFKDFGQFGRSATNISNRIGNVAASKNMVYGAASLLALIPIVGGALGQLAHRTLAGAESAQDAASKLAVSRSTDFKGSVKPFFSVANRKMYDLGLTPAEVINEMATMRTSTGKDIKGVGQILGAKSYMGIGNEISGVYGVSRYGKGDIESVLRIIEKDSKTQTQMSELVKTYISTSNRILSVNTNINEEGIAKAIKGIQQSTNMKGMGLDRTVGAIQGLGSSNNPLIKSMMMRSYRLENPNASIWDIQKMMETPLSEKSLPGTQRMLSDLKKRVGVGGDAYKQVLYSLFEGKLSRNDIDNILRGGGSFDDILNKFNSSGKSGIDFVSAGGKQVGNLKQATTRTSAFYQKAGINMSYVDIPGIMDSVKDTVEKIKETAKEVSDNYNKNLKTSKENLELGMELMRTAKTTGEWIKGLIISSGSMSANRSFMR